MARFEADHRPDQTVVWDVATLTSMRELISGALSTGARPPRFLYGIARPRFERMLETIDALLAQARQGWVVVNIPRRTIDDLSQLWRAARRSVRGA